MAVGHGVQASWISQYLGDLGWPGEARLAGKPVDPSACVLQEGQRDLGGGAVVTRELGHVVSHRAAAELWFCHAAGNVLSEGDDLLGRVVAGAGEHLLDLLLTVLRLGVEISGHQVGLAREIAVQRFLPQPAASMIWLMPTARTPRA